MFMKTANFNKNQAIRFCAASKGGIYAPIDSITLPNENFSHVPEKNYEIYNT